MKITLTFTDGNRLGQTETLDLSSPATVGRSSSCQLQLRDPSNKTSKRHFEIRATDSGAEVVCLGQSGMHVGQRKLVSNQVEPLAKGALIVLPDGSKLRVDDIFGATPAGASAPTAGDGRTMSIQPRPTGATAFPTEATRFSATAATAFGEARGGTAATAFGEARGGTAATAFGEARGAPAATRRYAAPAADAITGSSGVSGDYVDAPTGDSSTRGGGETVVADTRHGGPDEWKRIQARMERERRFRRKMRALAALGVAALVGLVVYWRWPTDDRWLSHPRPIAQHVLRNGAGRVEMVVDYPDNGKAHVNRRGDGGLEVLSMTGKRRDVEFRLQFDRRKKETVQLRLSLEDAAAREIAELKRMGYEFSLPDDDVRLAPGERDGFFFFEHEYPKSCQVKTLRGVRFFKNEFVRSEGGQRWHGVMIFFRNGDTAYRLLREIPDGEWERGKWLLRVDPNIALYATFLAGQWESPGEKALLLDQKRETLRQSVDLRLMRNNPTEWEATQREIDTLVVMSWNAVPEVRNDARLLLAKFRSQVDVFYREGMNRMHVDGKVSSALRGAFHDERDARYFQVRREKKWQ